jgi:UDP-glucose 4-epimerase
MDAKRASVLVAGGAGYIGSHTVLALLDAGHSVVVLDNLSTGNRWAVDPRAAFFEGGIENESLVRTIMDLHNIHAVVQLAGAYRTSGDASDPLRFYRNNTTATESLIESAVACGVRHFVYSGTAENYRLPAPAPIPENWGQAPNSAYAASILVTEQILIDATAAHPFNFGVLRYFNAAAADPLKRCGPARPGVQPDGDHMIRQAIAVILGRRDYAELAGSSHDTADGSLVRDYVHVCDLAAAHVALLGGLIAEPERNRAYNCGYGIGWSDLAVLEAAARVTNVRVARREVVPAKALPPVLVSDSAALRRELDWQPAYDNLDTLVRDAYRWEMHLPRLRMAQSEPPVRAAETRPLYFVTEPARSRGAEAQLVTRRAPARASGVAGEP